MARLKTLTDGADEATAAAVALTGETAATEGLLADGAAEAALAVAVEPAPEPAPVAPSPDDVSTSLGTSGERGGNPAAPSDADPIAAASAVASEARARADAVEAEYLAQSDKLATANATIASLRDKLSERDAALDNAQAAIAQRDAQIAALGASPIAPVAEVVIERPKVGKALKLPEDGERAAAADVMASLDAGGVVVMVLADDGAVVQPYPPAIGGKGLFTVHGSGLLYSGTIDLNPEIEQVTVRYAVLLDSAGKVLSTCRLGALLIGGAGLSAMIPGNNLRFDFD
ncbi:hypothetical protein [Novosphingobium sp. FKTRR1]|uniref:hypothetical protein n=1 Tax=Novosphingobium sp. FKTRR1 TaxID=2879118 RepID=UPI001CEFD5F9|nr:hypothetical protein [Novosphingobium sp. FKTRR1]